MLVVVVVVVVIEFVGAIEFVGVVIMFVGATIKFVGVILGRVVVGVSVKLVLGDVEVAGSVGDTEVVVWGVLEGPVAVVGATRKVIVFSCSVTSFSRPVFTLSSEFPFVLAFFLLLLVVVVRGVGLTNITDVRVLAVGDGLISCSLEAAVWVSSRSSSSKASMFFLLPKISFAKSTHA